MAAFASQQALAAKVNVAGAKLNMKKTSARKAVKAFSARAQAVAAPAVRLIPVATNARPLGFRAVAARSVPESPRSDREPPRDATRESSSRFGDARSRLGSDDELIRFAGRAISARGAWRALISRAAARGARADPAEPRARPPRPPRATTRAGRVARTGVRNAIGWPCDASKSRGSRTEKLLRLEFFAPARRCFFCAAKTHDSRAAPGSTAKPRLTVSSPVRFLRRVFQTTGHRAQEGCRDW
jgi:hypothetical protein